MDRAKVKGSGPGTPLEDATCRQRNKTLLRAPSSIKGSDAFFGRRTAAACFAPDFPTSIRIRVLCSLGNASSPGLNKLSWRGLLCRGPPPPKVFELWYRFCSSHVQDQTARSTRSNSSPICFNSSIRRKRCNLSCFFGYVIYRAT